MSRSLFTRKNSVKPDESKGPFHLDRFQNKPILFSLKANIRFDGDQVDEPIVAGHVANIRTGDHLHIQGTYNPDWWIGRKVEEHSPMRFIPTSLKLENLRAHLTEINKPGNLNKYLLRSRESGRAQRNGKTHCVDQKSNDDLKSGHSHLVKHEIRKKILLIRKPEVVPPYFVVPHVRPIILIGPSLKGSPVTDLIQAALLDFLKNRLGNKILVTKVGTDLSLAKRSVINNTSKRPILERKSSRNTDMIVIQNEIERIFELCKSLKLIVLDCDNINHPSQLTKTPLNPILVYLKISNLKVLYRLIKARDTVSSPKNINLQLAAAEKLSLWPHDKWEIILHENYLEDAGNTLCERLHEFWRAAHPNTRVSLVESVSVGPVEIIGGISKTMKP